MSCSDVHVASCGVTKGARCSARTTDAHEVQRMLQQAKALPASAATACGAQVKLEDQAQHDEDTHCARGWRPSDPAPTSISAAHTSTKRKQASSHRHDTDVDYMQVL